VQGAERLNLSGALAEASGVSASHPRQRPLRSTVRQAAGELLLACAAVVISPVAADADE
jgi:hypothetical protein